MVTAKARATTETRRNARLPRNVAPFPARMQKRQTAQQPAEHNGPARTRERKGGSGAYEQKHAGMASLHIADRQSDDRREDQQGMKHQRHPGKGIHRKTGRQRLDHPRTIASQMSHQKTSRRQQRRRRRGYSLQPEPAAQQERTCQQYRNARRQKRKGKRQHGK
jgi:hypothetical protein